MKSVYSENKNKNINRKTNIHTIKPHLKTSFSCLTLLSGYFLGHVSSRKALAYASGPAFTWGEGERHFSSVQCFNQRGQVCVWRQIHSRHLDTDAALQLQLQADHVHLAGRAQLLDFCHFLAHLVDGHLDGAQVGVVLVHHCDALLHVGETVCGCRGTTNTHEGLRPSKCSPRFYSSGFTWSYFKLKVHTQWS